MKPLLALMDAGVRLTPVSTDRGHRLQVRVGDEAKTIDHREAREVMDAIADWLHGIGR